MPHKQLQFKKGFRVVLGDEHSQAAQMTLAPNETEGGPDNRHRGADQWLYLVSGSGVAVVNGERVELREGTLVLIQRGDTHEIRNTGFPDRCRARCAAVVCGRPPARFGGITSSAEPQRSTGPCGWPRRSRGPCRCRRVATCGRRGG
jgi:mannose-6-phosphate isomerase-like protein (cupin superfamily)